MIWGSLAKRARTSSGRSVATTTARRSGRSIHRRGSPATTPPRSSATEVQSARARFSIEPGAPTRLGRCERRDDLRLRARADTTNLAQPALGSGRPKLSDRPDAERCADVDEAFAANPCNVTNAASSGETLLRSSSSSAIRPVSTSSRNRASIPRPMPRRLRTRRSRTRSNTLSGVVRTSCAPRRNARAAKALASLNSSRAAYSSRADASSAFASRVPATCSESGTTTSLSITAFPLALRRARSDSNGRPADSKSLPGVSVGRGQSSHAARRGRFYGSSRPRLGRSRPSVSTPFSTPRPRYLGAPGQARR